MKEQLAKSDHDVNKKQIKMKSENRLLLGLNNDRSSTRNQCYGLPSVELPKESSPIQVQG